MLPNVVKNNHKGGRKKGHKHKSKAQKKKDGWYDIIHKRNV